MGLSLMVTGRVGVPTRSLPFTIRGRHANTRMSDNSEYVTLEQVEELLEEQRKEFEAKLEAKDERIDRLEGRVDDLESSHELTQSTVWELEDTVTGEYDFSHPHLQGESVIDRLDGLEDTLEGCNPQGDGGETTLHDTVGEDYTPIERLSVLGEDALDEHVTASDRRAVALFEHWKEWSTNTPQGNLLKTSDSLKSLLSTATDEHLAWKQVYRACRRVMQLSKGRITFFQHDKHGWMLKQHSAFASHQATNTGVTSSSVA